MSKYWVYIDDEVAGPYTVDQLIRLRGFSRQARVCSQEGNEGPQKWISPADIPELSHIFKAVDETRPVMLPPRPKAKPSAPKPPRPRPPAATPVPEPAPVRPRRPFPWLGLLSVLGLCAAIAGGYYGWQQNTLHRLEREKVLAKQLIENVQVSTPAGPSTLKSYMAQKNIEPRWDYERQPSGVYNVSLSWFENGAGGIASSVINAFEVNLEAQTVRPLNSRAAKLLQGSGAPPKVSPTPAKPKTPEFKEALSDWQGAMQAGDFETVWNAYSDRKIQDMSKGGISHSGFVRLQSLTHKLETGMQLNVVKTKKEGEESRLVLLKQTQKGQPDIFIRQYWIMENNAWKLDDEQKKTATAPAVDESATGSSASDSEPPAASSRPPVTSLPGIAH